MSEARPVPWEVEAELALRAVSSVSERLGAPSGTTMVSVKGALRDVVSSDDLAVESALRETLRPSPHPVFGEETIAEAGSLPATGAFWLLDPIDGTANYLAGIPLYAVSVGLLDAGIPVTGAVALPAQKELFFTHGNRSYLNGSLLAVAPDVALEDALLGICLSSRGDERRPDELRLFAALNEESRGCLRLGSAAVSICYVAASRLTACWGVSVKLWDVAGALAVARGAGATVALRFDPATFRADFLVAVPGLFPELLGRLATVVRLEGAPS